MAAKSYSTNTGLSALPEVSQKEYPTIWADLMRVRNAIDTLALALDAHGNVPGGGSIGQYLTKTGAGDYIVGWNNLTLPVITPTTPAAFVNNPGTAVTDACTFDGYTLSQIVRALRTLGLLT